MSQPAPSTPADTPVPSSEPPQPPVAERRPVVQELHGDRRIDEWAWLRDRDDPAVLSHLRAENAYTEAMTAATAGLRERLYEEIVGRVQETDTGAPVPDAGFVYYARTEAGRQYPLLCRRPRHRPDAPEQVILDQNALAAGHDYCRVGDAVVSPDQRLLAYSVDFSGAELFTVRFRDLESGEDLPDVVERVYYSLAWASDSATILGTRTDAAMRPHQVWRRRLGAAAGSEETVFEEPDERFFGAVARTRSGAFVVLGLGSHTTSEAWVLDAAAPEQPFRRVSERRQGVEYSVDHHGDRLLIVTNDGAVNFRLMSAPVGATEREHWVELLDQDDEVKLDGVDPFAGHLVLYERAGGVRRIRVGSIGADGSLGALELLGQPEAVSTATPGENREWDTGVLRFEYTSLTTPPSSVDHDLRSGARTVVRVQPVLGGYDPAEYVSERLWARAADGVRVPVSVVRRRDLPRDGRAPALLYGYGSYEHSIDPAFRSARLSLLERGGVYAIAHVRGGGEMGRRWYESGKMAHKRNSIGDFVAAAEALIEAGYSAPDRLGIRGGSAGGLLMGASLNLRPDLFRAVVAEVPFVDVINTMLDDSLPLTVIEWEEWGNPSDAEQYRWMREYSPYDNVAAVAHPAVLATGGLNDPRVGYWEPAKWVQRLRDCDRGDRPILLKMELGAGHGGRSGRYDAWRDEAFVLAFLIDQLPGWRDVPEAASSSGA